MKFKTSLTNLAHFSALSISILALGVCTHLLSNNEADITNRNVQAEYKSGLKVVSPSVREKREFDLRVMSNLHNMKQASTETVAPPLYQTAGGKGFAGKASQKGVTYIKPYIRNRQTLPSVSNQDNLDHKSLSKSGRQEDVKCFLHPCHQTLLYKGGLEK
ncbi:MAG: hypothetical protein AAGA75_27015 [Cyanobacteria bacterium P01_E01_bin.6]